MSTNAAAPAQPAGPVVAPAQPKALPDLEPPYHVILHDDDDHTYEYVILMLADIFGYEMTKGFELACLVNDHGLAIVATCHKELAELRVDQIENYGPDPKSSKKDAARSMKATMEPAA